MVLTSRTEEEFNRTGSKIKISRKRKQNEWHEEVYALYSAYTREELEKNTLLFEAKQKGLEQGINQRNIEITKNLLNQKVDISIIMMFK
jgi:hypothetical protein